MTIINRPTGILTRPSLPGTTVDSHMLFDIVDTAPDVAAALMREVPELADVVSRVRAHIPLAPSVEPPPSSGFYRLPTHYRALCLAVDDLASVPLYDSQVLVLKGTEPLLPDYPAYLRWMTTAKIRQEELPIAECFPLTAGGVPAGVTLYEAVREYRLTLELQSEHVRYYGELAHAPVPLFVHQMSEDDNLQCAQHLRRELSEAAFERANPMLRKLAAIVLYYPASPIRADFYSQVSHASWRPTRLLPPLEILRSWVRLLARMLYLSYMPFARWGMGRGCCFDSGNAAIDGGVLDCDSIVPFSMLTDDLGFYRGWLWSIECVRQSFVATLGLQQSDAEAVFRYLSHNFVVSEIEHALETEARPGLVLDARIRNCIRNRALESLFTCRNGRELSLVPYSVAAATAAS